MGGLSRNPIDDGEFNYDEHDYGQQCIARRREWLKTLTGRLYTASIDVSSWWLRRRKRRELVVLLNEARHEIVRLNAEIERLGPLPSNDD